MHVKLRDLAAAARCGCRHRRNLLLLHANQPVLMQERDLESALRQHIARTLPSSTSDLRHSASSKRLRHSTFFIFPERAAHTPAADPSFNGKSRRQGSPGPHRSPSPRTRSRPSRCRWQRKRQSPSPRLHPHKNVRRPCLLSYNLSSVPAGAACMHARQARK